jgi:guanylate kinase
LLQKAILERFPQLKKVVSYTTREPREGEAEGIDYYFVDDAAFEEMNRNNEFIDPIQHVRPNEVRKYGPRRSDFEKLDVAVGNIASNIARKMKQITQERGGKSLMIGVVANEYVRRDRIKKRQPGVTETEVDQLVSEDLEQDSTYDGFDVVIRNENDPESFVRIGLQMVEDFLKDR